MERSIGFFSEKQAYAKLKVSVTLPFADSQTNLKAILGADKDKWKGDLTYHTAVEVQEMFGDDDDPMTGIDLITKIRKALVVH